MRVALTGVPGTGKTSIATALALRGVHVVHLHAFAEREGLLGEEDPVRGSRLVDVDALNARLDVLYPAEAARTLVEGHFAHEMDAHLVILLRCHPLELADRLRTRGWSEPKVRENVEAEALDVLAQEVLESGLPAYELDATDLSVEAAADAVWAIVEKRPEALKGRAVGTVAWPLPESLPWS